MSHRKVAVVGVSGNGKTTFARELARRLDAPYVELDAICWQPGWRMADNEEFRRDVEAATAGDCWVVDGSYEGKLGSLVYDQADTVVWLDQPLAIALSRLVRRAMRDIVTQRDLFNGNRQTWRGVFYGRDALLLYAIRSHFRRRRVWPARFGSRPQTELVRLCSRREVRGWLEAQG
jgi:adenylate kinase family enzyme